MNVEFFIARRIFSSQHKKDSGTRSGTRPIISIATIGIAIGIAVMILSWFIVTGFQNEIRTKVVGFGSHLTITNFDANNSIEATPISKDEAFVDQLKKAPGVRHVQPFANKAGIIKTKDNVHGVVLKGVDASFDWSFFKRNKVQGSTIDLNTEKRSKDIMVSEAIAKKLKLNVGDTINVFFIQKMIRARAMRIVGTYETSLEQFDNSMVLCDLRQIQSLNRWEENDISGFEVLMASYDDLLGSKEELRKVIPSYFMVTEINERHTDIFGWLELQDYNVYFIIGLMILVASINMASALLILILDRTNMIGMLKALGARDISVQRIFIYNGAFIITRGLLWGNVLGLGLAILQANYGFLTLPKESYYIEVVPINFDLLSVAFLNLGTLALCTTVLLLPSFLVTRISPVKAIRFD